MDTESALTVHSVSLEKKENAAAHHTSEFQTQKLVLRRGQIFKMKVVLNRSPKSQDELKLTFSTGERSPHLVELDPMTSFRSKGWQVKITKQSGGEVTLAVISAADAMVGKYSLHVNEFKAGIFFLLFNPWCADDSVFMPSEEQRAEYILNDTGYIYMGFAKQIKEKPWTFGQFEKHILNCCFSLLAHLEPSELQNPVIVSRAICTMMCAVNNGGVLVGNWSGDYSKGTAPYVWTSSVPILQQHYITREPVCFGQCWVFSGILTTALRAVGIPARSVTNFESAHDTGKNLIVDIYLDESGKTITHLTKDSVWNFHVWTDAWMKRHDLPQGHDGWQVLDATPQEISEGGFRTGPSPLSAIRLGKVEIKYDTKFVFTEVNGDKFIWLVKQNQGREKNILIAVETASIGRNISTKMVGENKREDITLQYKFPEGSPEERKAMEKAAGKHPDEDKPSRRPVNSMLRIRVLQNSVELGYPITLTLVLKRKTATPQNVNISCSLDLQTYTGSQKTNLGIIHRTVQIQGQESEVVLSMDANSYIYKLGMVDDEVVIKGFIIAEITETGDKVATDITLSFLYPAFSVEMPDTGKVNSPLFITCSFKNTLPIPLTNIRFSVESLALLNMQSWDQGTVPPGQSITFQMKCTPVRSGPKKFIVKFTSRQVKEVHAEKIILITK